MHPTTGPRARAKAPSERNMPSTEPFWSSFPYLDTRVVRQVTAKAVEIANRVMPAYSIRLPSARPTTTKAGTIRYKLKMA